MNIIDTNGVSYIFKNRISLKDEYLLVPEVAEEVEMTQLIHRRTVPSKVLEIITVDVFDEVIYLEHYRQMLNKHGGRSFFNMTGFGDISILATLHTVLAVFAIQKVERLFDPTEQIVVFTDDTRLTSRINIEFASKNIVVKQVNDIK